ncbi:MAG: low molecular weight phosphatase family protein [Chloroflexota bacterium]
MSESASESTSPDMTRIALFLCSGNYHRSRFAEHLFNAIARERGLSWRAVSRGTIVEDSKKHFRGMMSAEAQQALDTLGIEFRSELRDPSQLTDDDLAAAAVIVAVCEEEHRPHIERDFQSAAERVQYWSVYDVPAWPAERGLATLEALVRELVDTLAVQSQQA